LDGSTSPNNSGISWSPRACKRWRKANSGLLQDPFNNRTKTERLATILLPNPVAAHDTKGDATDGRSKIIKENSTLLNGLSLAETAVTEFRVRCIQPLCHLSGADNYQYFTADPAEKSSAACPGSEIEFSKAPQPAARPWRRSGRNGVLRGATDRDRTDRLSSPPTSSRRRFAARQCQPRGACGLSHSRLFDGRSCRMLVMPDSALPSSPARSRPALWAAAVIIGLMVGATIVLWAHYGTAVFFEMIVAGIAACL
jgi:hypothetical protein